MRQEARPPLPCDAPAHIQLALYKPLQAFRESPILLRTAATAFLALVSIVASQPCLSAELLMFRRVGCPYCLAWERAVGPVYGKTDLGRRAPLRKVDLDKEDPPAIALKRAVRYTPTFVLVEDGREIGRIEGYPGEDFFWGLLDKLVGSLPDRS